jgi:hypothetical protein
MTSFLLLAAALGAVAVGRFGDVRVEALLVPVLTAVFIVHCLMPLWVAGLLVRDEPADDTDALAAELPA